MAKTYYRMSRDDNPDIVRVTGYGVDYTPPGTTGFRNTDSQTQQTEIGSFIGEVIESASDVYIEYIVDTMGGNSGSPVIILGSTMTVGIHTDGGCDPPTEGNFGTGFENNALENAIQTFPGANVTYVDKDHPVVQEDGSIFRPFDTVTEAINAVTAGGVISIVKGTYNQSKTISKAMTLTAPVGSVIIGQ